MASESHALRKALALVRNIQENSDTEKLKRNWFRPPSWEVDLSPYPWQAQWCNASRDFNEISLMCANQIGKNTTAAAMVSCHATGEYPDWYIGRRWNRPVEILCASQTNKLVRDTMQEDLLGKVEKRKASGHGWIPKKNIGTMTIKNADVPDCVDTIKVRHVSGGWSTIYFMAYKQGTDAFQGFKRDVAWLDEEPKRAKDEQGIFSEVQIRLAAKNGLLYFTRTPLYGLTRAVSHFVKRAPGSWYMVCGWKHAPHLSPERKAQLLASIPSHEVKTRTEGAIMMGAGAVFDFDIDDKLVVPEREVPEWFARIAGIDFGIEHPQATVWMAVDREAGPGGKILVYDEYSESGGDAIAHTAACLRHGPEIPIAYPHDGDTREKSTGETLAEVYRSLQCNLNTRSARWEEHRAGGQPVDRAVMEIYKRMRMGTLEIMDNCVGLINEMKGLYRENSQIQAIDDDKFKAFTYGMMDARLAKMPGERLARQPYAEGRDYDPLAAGR